MAELLSDKTAIITGAARGIGRGIAIEYASHGANVVLADINVPGMHETVARLPKNSQLLIVPTDITYAAQRTRLLEKARERFGRIEVLVNNAAIVDFGRDIVLDPPELQTRQVWEVNYHCQRYLAREVADYMKDAEIPGSIIFISSVHGELVRMQEHYHASKAALNATMQEMAVKYGPDIRVNVIAPGAIYTQDNPTIEDLKGNHFRYETVLGRMGLPHEVGGAAVYLASELASYVTGEIHNVDGGLRSLNWVTQMYLRDRIQP